MTYVLGKAQALSTCQVFDFVNPSASFKSLLLCVPSAGLWFFQIWCREWKAGLDKWQDWQIIWLDRLRFFLRRYSPTREFARLKISTVPSLPSKLSFDIFDQTNPSHKPRSSTLHNLTQHLIYQTYLQMFECLYPYHPLSDSHLSLQCPTDPTAVLQQSTRFLPFSETIQLAARYDLPLVGYVRASVLVVGWWVVGWLFFSGKRQKEWWVPREHDPVFVFSTYLLRLVKVVETFLKPTSASIFLPDICKYLPTWHVDPLSNFIFNRPRNIERSFHRRRDIGTGTVSWWKGPYRNGQIGKV